MMILICSSALVVCIYAALDGVQGSNVDCSFEVNVSLHFSCAGIDGPFF